MLIRILFYFFHCEAILHFFKIEVNNFKSSLTISVPAFFWIKALCFFKFSIFSIFLLLSSPLNRAFTHTVCKNQVGLKMKTIWVLNVQVKVYLKEFLRSRRPSGGTLQQRFPSNIIKIIWTFIMEKKHALKKHTLEVKHVMRARKETRINML